MSENNCFTYFIQISSCLQLEGKSCASYTFVVQCAKPLVFQIGKLRSKEERSA